MTERYSLNSLRRYSRHLLKTWWVCQPGEPTYLTISQTNRTELVSYPLDVNWMRTSWGRIKETGKRGNWKSEKLKNLPQLLVGLRGVIKLIKDRKSARTSIIYCAWVWEEWNSWVLSRKKWERNIYATHSVCCHAPMEAIAFPIVSFNFCLFSGWRATITNT